jgi:GWxTD domain-containing protein
MRNATKIIILTIIAVGFISCGGMKVNTTFETKRFEEFYDQTRLIMFKSERQIFKHLPDDKSRDEFIRDFWKKRDPSPGTMENENRLEFQHRIQYVERWFREKVGSSRGWDSDRGKIFLLLGQPDTRSSRQGNIVDNMGQLRKVLKEIWVYDYHRLYLDFADSEGFGVYRLRNWEPELLNAIDRAKFLVVQDKSNDHPLKFKARYKEKGINISIPVKTISFQEIGDQMQVTFKVLVYVYRNYKKIDNMTETRTLEGEKSEFVNQKNIDFTLPYSPSEQGKYYFEIILEEVATKARYRDMISYKNS